MWPTPTPFPISTPSINIHITPEAIVGQFTTDVVQGWNLFDASSVATVVFIGLLLLVIFLGLMSIRAHMEKL